MGFQGSCGSPLMGNDDCSSWWNQINQSGLWQDRIFNAIAALYAVVGIFALVQLVRIQLRTPEYGWTTQKVFHLLNFVVNVVRSLVFVFRRNVQKLQPDILQYVVLNIPSLAFFTTFVILVLFWAEIYYQARAVSIDGLRPTFYTINGVVYAFQILLWSIIWWKPVPAWVIVSKLFFAGVYLFAALGFLLYGGRCRTITRTSFYENGAISIILEYMDGGSLADFLKNVKSIPEPYLAVITKQVLKGLWYLHHEKHIIHRDLKPSNLLVNHRGEVKITDFGVSAILASTSGLANTFVGTYNYMSPERIIGGKYGYRSDIWSLGLVLLECALGHFPYFPPQQGEGWTNVYELMETIVDQPPPSPPADQFSPEFCSFISHCLQKEPKDRLSANELMAHPFISMFSDLDIDLASYFTEAGSPLATF